MKKLVTPIPQNTTELATPAPVSWIILTFVLSYLLNLSLSRYAWTPDFLALSMVFWVVHQPRRVGMTVAFVCGILMDVHNGSVLGQQALVYVILTYCAFSLHRRLPWFNLVGQALHVLPLLLLSQVIVLLSDCGSTVFGRASDGSCRALRARSCGRSGSPFFRAFSATRPCSEIIDRLRFRCSLIFKKRKKA